MERLRVHYLQHVTFEKPGYFEVWALANGHVLTGTKLFEGEKIPKIVAFDWLIVMGGPMNVDDEHQYGWLKEENFLIGEAIRAGITVIGVCLGSQLIAQVLRARVYQSHTKEIGWFPVSLTRYHPITFHLPTDFTVLHWHGDTFDLPDSGVRLIESLSCKHQAFLNRERVLGLQFHLEATPATLSEMVENCGHELIPAEFIQSQDDILGRSNLCSLTNGFLEGILNYLSREPNK